MQAAQQFEALLLQEMLKPMQPGSNSGDGEGEDSDHAADTLSSFGIEAVAQAIAKGGGVGIARRVIQEVTHEVTTKYSNETPKY